MAIPTYIMDTPSGKIPLQVDPILGLDASDILIEDIDGKVWREPKAGYTLEDLRDEVATIDRHLVSLLAKRLSWAQRIGSLKKEQGEPIEQPEWEEQVRERFLEQGRDRGLNNKDLEEVLSLILALSKKAQS
jgi:chorismate mutase